MKKIIIILLFPVIASCSQSRRPMEGIGTISLSPDDKHIVFSHYTNDLGEIYISELDGSNVKKLIPSEDGTTSCIFPAISSDGKRIAYLRFLKDKKVSNIFLVDFDGNNNRQISFQDQIIKQVIFSSDGSRLYYTKANTYDSYSPIGRKALHGFDIFYMDLSDLKERKLTNMNAYDISSINLVVNDEYLLIRLVDDLKGLVIFPLQNPNNLISFTPENDPRHGDDFYDDPAYSIEYDKVAFTAPYELYLMDFENKEANLIYRPKDGEMLSHINNVSILKTSEQIMFKREDEKNAFRIINFDGTEMKRVLIFIP